jgi:hypothetical protein
VRLSEGKAEDVDVAGDEGPEGGCGGAVMVIATGSFGGGCMVWRTGSTLKSTMSVYGRQLGLTALSECALAT